MPSTSKAQQRLMGAALSMKRGQAKPSGEAAGLAKHMSAKQLSDFAGTKRKGLPEHKDPPKDDPPANDDPFEKPVDGAIRSEGSVNGTDGKIVKKADGWHCIDENGDDVGGPYKSKIDAHNMLAKHEYDEQHNDSGRPHMVIVLSHGGREKRSRSGGVAKPADMGGDMGGGAMPGM